MRCRTACRYVFSVVLILGVLATASMVLTGQAARPAGWTEATHGAKGTPNYALLFAMDRVHELRITIPAGEFKKMQDDLATVAPAAATGDGSGAGRGGFDPQQMQAHDRSLGQGVRGQGRRGGVRSRAGERQLHGDVRRAGAGVRAAGNGEDDARRRHDADLEGSDLRAGHGEPTTAAPGRKVAMRYKGNSSLTTAIATENGKVPFRLDFNRFAKADPATAGQRFHGFEEMTFSSNFADDSMLREVLGNEIFRDRGVPAPRSAFYRIYVDTGSGPEYLGPLHDGRGSRRRRDAGRAARRSRGEPLQARWPWRRLDEVRQGRVQQEDQRGRGQLRRRRSGLRRPASAPRQPGAVAREARIACSTWTTS